MLCLLDHAPKYARQRASKCPRIFQKNPNPTIKPADKGSCIVVMDISNYIEEEGRQFLEDRTTYKKLEIANKLLNKYIQDEWTWKHHTMNPEYVRTQRFYFLHKVHKLLVNSVPSSPVVVATHTTIQQTCENYQDRVLSLVTTLIPVINLIEDLDVPNAKETMI